MTTTDPAPAPAPVIPQSLIARVQGILLTPAAEWDRIEPEAATVQGLFIGYAAILAAIPAIATLLGYLLFNRLFLIVGVIAAVASYAINLAVVFLVGFVIDALAPSFGAQKNLVQAMKLSVYSFTAVWVAGVVGFIPVLGALIALGAAIYGFYILYLGFEKLTKSPADKTVGYYAVSLVIAFISYVILTWIVVIMVATMTVGAAFSGAAATLNNHASTLAQLQNVAAQVQANANNQPPPPGSVHAVPADTLKALLPATLAGLPRTDLSSTTGAAAGISGSNAEGVYADPGGDKRITLSITDMAALGAVASLASTMNVESDHETATGYDKVSKIGGRMTEEQFDTQSKTGKYSVLVANRFMVDAEGSGVGIDDLKAAVNGVGFDKLEGMAHA
jgi:hypothetical protein